MVNASLLVCLPQLFIPPHFRPPFSFFLPPHTTVSSKGYSSFLLDTKSASVSLAPLCPTISALFLLSPSLEAYINKRIDLMKADDPSLVMHEKALLTKLVNLRMAVVDPLLDAEVADPVYKYFRKTWAAVQSYYLKSRARVVVVTAATALHYILDGFHPRRIIIDEASQMKEHTAVALIAKHFNKLSKTTLIGDLAQLGVFVPPQPSEFSVQTKLSCMGRLAASGVPTTMLNTQYRMHPHISRIVSHLFYEDRLLNHQSVLFREDDKKWTTSAREAFGIRSPQHSLFVSTTPGPVYYTVKGRSLANPRHACIVGLILNNLIKAGAAPNQIAILCGYKAQLRVLRALPSNDGVTLTTIYAAQGREYPFVLLGLVTPGGTQYPLGFLTDTGRMCVALSRAMNGMLIVGSEKMAEGKRENHGIQGWKTLVEDHKNRGALASRLPPDNMVTGMLERLGLKGPQWAMFTRKM